MITWIRAVKISQEKIETLHPDFKPKVLNWFEAMIAQGMYPYIYEGFRTLKRQEELFKMGPDTTRARPKESYHNYGFAIDWVPLIAHPKAIDMFETIWHLPKDVQNRLYSLGQNPAISYGLKSLSWEQPHLQDVRYSHHSELYKKFGETLFK